MSGNIPWKIACAGGVVAALVLVASCSTPKPVPVPLATCGQTPPEVLACARAREASVSSLRVLFDATMHRDDESHTTTGVLLVSKPERFRLRLMLPLGLTVFDCLKNGADVHVTLPLQGGSPSSSQPRSPMPFATIDFEETFLRDAYAFPDPCEARQDGAEVLVRCGASSGERWREMRLDPKTATIISETSYENDTPRFTLRYSDYRVVGSDGVVLPGHITLGYPAQNVTLDIEVQRYELNPQLSSNLFRVVAE